MRRESFLGMALPVPNNVDAVLERQYGTHFLTMCQTNRMSHRHVTYEAGPPGEIDCGKLGLGISTSRGFSLFK